MKETKITCDLCGCDIGTTGAMPAFRYVLSPERIEHGAGPGGSYFVNAVAVYPWIDRPYHFCRRQCLIDWLKENMER